MTATTPVAPAADPRLARAEFLFDLDLAELTAVIPQAKA